MKKIKLSFLLTVCMCMMGTKVSAQDLAVENSQGKTIYYSYCSDGRELAVTRNKNGSGRTYSGDVIIPEEVTYMNRTRKVTAIDYLAFTNCLGLTSVTLPNSIKSIGIEAFANCEKLTSFTIPDGVTSIGKFAFGGCSGLTAITIPGSMKSIGKEAFKGCTQLSTLIISDGVQSIGESAFSGLYKITNLTIPNSVTYVGDYAFANTGLTSVTIGNGATLLKSTFDNCRRLTSVVIPNGVTTLRGTFYGCTNLTSITIPPSVTEIGVSSFWDCEKLTAVHISDLAAWCKIKFGTNGSNRTSNPLIYAHHLYLNGEEIKDLVIPEGVTTISSIAFGWLTNLNSLTIPKSVTGFGGNVFIKSTIPTIYCNITNPTKILGKTSDSAVFSLDTFNNASLIVPAGMVGKYQAVDGWKDFVFIEEKK